MDSQKNAVRLKTQGLKGVLAAALLGVRTVLGGDRTGRIYNGLVEALKDIPCQKPLLDYGCGNQFIGHRLIQQGFFTSAVGVDVYEGVSSISSYAYVRHQGLPLPFEAGTFSVAIVVDVLHHIGVERAAEVLQDLSRVADVVIVKDHFEYGFWTRFRLRCADWFGNWAYGVNIPKRYFSEALWEASTAPFVETRVCPFTVHQGLFAWILPSRCHFISVLKCVKREPT